MHMHYWSLGNGIGTGRVSRQPHVDMNTSFIKNTLKGIHTYFTTTSSSHRFFKVIATNILMLSRYSQLTAD